MIISIFIIFHFSCLTLAIDHCFKKDDSLGDCNTIIELDNIRNANDIYCYVHQNIKYFSSADPINGIEKKLDTNEKLEAAWMAIHQNEMKFKEPSKLQELVTKSISENDGVIRKIKGFFHSHQDPLVCYIRSLLETKHSNALEQFKGILGGIKGKKNLVSRILKSCHEMEADIESLESSDANYSIIILKQLSNTLKEHCYTGGIDNEIHKNCHDHQVILEKKIKEIKENYKNEMEKDFEKLNILMKFYSEFSKKGLNALLEKLSFSQLQKLNLNFDINVQMETANRIVKAYSWKSDKDAIENQMINEYFDARKEIDRLEGLKDSIEQHSALKEKSISKEEIDQLFINALGGRLTNVTGNDSSTIKNSLSIFLHGESGQVSPELEKTQRSLKDLNSHSI